MGSIEESDHDRPARDTHALPPDPICQSYWTYNKAKPSEIDVDPDVIDFRRGLTPDQSARILRKKSVPASVIATACQAFRESSSKQSKDDPNYAEPLPEECVVYEHIDLPGLTIYTQLLPPATQLLLLSQIMHRDLANPDHKTNINADYQVPYPTPTPVVQEDGTLVTPYPSFFTRPQSSPSETLQPKNATGNHKPLNMSQHLQKKLRWLTLGAQYNWPTRSYSGTDLTSFPSDIATLVSGLFPDLNAQSGVVLLYSPKDFMPVHRDVSEQCERGLASFSLGCDGLFVIARDSVEGSEQQQQPPAAQKPIVIRVRSGDVVQLSGEARWAWHAMPKVLAGTCPEFMRDWPAGSEESMGYGRGSRAFERWKGYMAGKRLNLSCREVWG